MDKNIINYTVPDYLYELAYQLYDEKFWLYIPEDLFFLVKTRDGKNVYVQTLGYEEPIHNPYEYGVFLYIGDENFKKIRRFYELPADVPGHILKEATIASESVTLRFKYLNNFNMHDIPKNMVWSYQDRLEPNRPRRRALPYFIHKRPYIQDINFNENAKYTDYLAQVIQATINLTKMIKSGVFNPPAVGVNGGFIVEETIGGWLPVEFTSFPKHDESTDVYYTPTASDELIDQLKKLPKRGDADIERTIVPDPERYSTYDEEFGIEVDNFIPAVAVSNDALGGGVALISLTNYQKNDQVDLEKISKALARDGFLPRRIYVQNERAACYIKDLADKLDIQVIHKDKLHLLNIILNSVHHQDQ